MNGQTIRRRSCRREAISQVELPVTIGLGDNKTTGPWTIIWPDGSRQEVANAKIDGLTTVVQPKK